MYARTVDEAQSRLVELRQEEWGALGLSALALAVSLAATRLYPPLVLPLFAGGLVVGMRGIRALWCRWDLVDRLAGERDAYRIPEVFAYAVRETRMDRRRSLAARARGWLEQPGLACESRVSAVADELEALACELEDGELEVDPASAVACMRMLSDFMASPLLNPALPSDGLESRFSKIRAGFRPRRSG